jgi:hypothetical protein
MAASNLFVNTSAQTLANALVRSVTDMSPVSLPQLVLGDNRSYNIYFVDGLGNYASFSGNASYIPYIAIGQCGYPTGGTFTLSFQNYFTTPALAWNASPATIQTELQALASIGAGNCSVSGVAGEWFTVTFTGALAGTSQPLIAAQAGLLTPISTITNTLIIAGGSGINCVQLLTFAINPVSFMDNWTPITNGWTGALSTGTLAIVEAFAAAGGTLSGQTFQVTVADPSGNFQTYVQAPVTVSCTVIDPSSFAGNYTVALATQAALNAAILGLNNFTFQSAASSVAGNINITPQTTSRHHTAIVTFSGSAGTRTLSVLTSNSPNSGDTVLVVILPGTTAGLVISIYNASTGGALLTSYTTDTSGQLQTVRLVYNGSAWSLALDSTQMLSKSQNLSGLASTLVSKANLCTAFSRVVSQITNFTAQLSDEGTLFQVNCSSGAVLATFPAAATAGEGFMLGLMKTDATANAVTTSPATIGLGAAGQVVLFLSNGTVWQPVLTYSPGALQPTVADTVLNWSFITDIGGSTPTSLNSQSTAGGAIPSLAIVMLSFGGYYQWWQLRPSTAATASGIQQPTDFNSLYNPQVWFLIYGTVPLVVNNATVPANNPSPPTGTLLHLTGADGTFPTVMLDGFGEHGELYFRRADGTSASPTAIQNVDALGSWACFGYNGSAYTTRSAVVTFVATENWTSSSNGTQVIINVTPNGGGTLSTALTIDQDLSLKQTGATFYSQGANTQIGSAYSLASTDVFIVANSSGTLTLTLGTPATGRQIWIRTITANTVVSAGSNVVPLAGGSAGTAILAATAGKWAMLVYDGTNWQIMAGN